MWARTPRFRYYRSPLTARVVSVEFISPPNRGWWGDSRIGVVQGYLWQTLSWMPSRRNWSDCRVWLSSYDDLHRNEKRMQEYSLHVALVHVEISKSEFYDLVRTSYEGIQETVNASGITLRIIGTAECSSLFAVRCRKHQARATWNTKKNPL